MNKQKKMLALLACIVTVSTSYGMDVNKEIPSGLFEPYETQIPLALVENAPVIQKKVFLSIPASSITPVGEAKASPIPPDIARSVLGTVRAFQKIQALDEMQNALVTCISLMFKNDKGWHFPENGPHMQFVNPELLAMVKLPKSYSMFSPEVKTLILRLDLGQQPDGWGYDQVIEIKPEPTHPRKGTCSDITIQYHHEQKAIHGKVALQDIRDFYQASGKTGKITRENCAQLRKTMNLEAFDNLHMQDVIAMIKHYLSKPEHIKSVVPGHGDASDTK